MHALDTASVMLMHSLIYFQTEGILLYFKSYFNKTGADA